MWSGLRMLDIKEIKEKLTIENLEKHRTWPILLGIFLIGFSIRYLTRHELLSDPDSYWWYRLAGYYSGVKTEYFYQENGGIRLQPANPTMQPIYIDDPSTIKIQGKVVMVMRQLEDSVA